MKKRVVGIIVIAVMAVSMLGCSKQEPVNSGSETHSEQSAAESVMADGNEGKADGLVAGSEEYNEEKVADLGNIQYAKIVFDNSSYSYPEDYFETMYHGKYEMILKRTEADVKFNVSVTDTLVGEVIYSAAVDVPYEALDSLQKVIVDGEMSRLDGYYMVNSAIGEGFELNIRYDSGEQIWGYAEGGYSVMPKKYWDEKKILEYIQSVLESKELTLTMAPEPKYYAVENPSWTYYFAGDSKDDVEHNCVTLVQTSAEQNDIIDDEKWFAYIGKNQPAWDYKEDEFFRYELYGGDTFYPIMVDIYDINSGEQLYTIDMSDFAIPDEIAPGDESFVNEFIRDIQYKDGVFYLIITHSTYANSAPHNAYIVALDENKDFSVIWKTEPLTCNSDNFAIIDNSIICGYGFTAEPDYIYVLDRYTGKRVARYNVKTGPDYFYISDKKDKLYVRTYDMNYEYSLE